MLSQKMDWRIKNIKVPSLGTFFLFFCASYVIIRGVYIVFLYGGII